MQLSLIVLSRKLKKRFGDVTLAKVPRDESLFIAIKTEEQKNKVLNCESTCKKCVRERKTLGEFKVVWGVIKGTSSGRSRKKKITQSISGSDVSRIKRLLRTVSGERVDRLPVMLEFQEPFLPGSSVKIGCMSFVEFGLCY